MLEDRNKKAPVMKGSVAAFMVARPKISTVVDQRGQRDIASHSAEAASRGAKRSCGVRLRPRESEHASSPLSYESGDSVTDDEGRRKRIKLLDSGSRRTWQLPKRGQHIPENKKDGTCRGEVSRVGNAGWYFCNVLGAEADSRLAEAVKKNLAQITGLRGCNSAFEARLQEAMEAHAAVAARPHAYEYLTIRTPLPRSTLVGVRGNLSGDLRLRKWERIQHGTYTVKGGSETMRAYSEVLLADVYTDQSISCIGTSHQAMVVRMHRNFACDKWPTSEVTIFWDKLASTLKLTSGTTAVLMGDFGKMVLKVVPELRSRGVVIDLAAWYPFRTVRGEPWVCSSAFFHWATWRVQAKERACGCSRQRSHRYSMGGPRRCRSRG